MLSFLSLKKYGFTNEDLTAEVNRRRNSTSAIRLKFDQDQYFYELVPQLFQKIEQILQAERTVLASLVAALPKSAVSYAQLSMVIREIHSTNTIEGVHSTRREVEETTVLPKQQRRRFSEFFEVLAELFLKNEVQNIDTLQGIRDLYTRVTAGELAPGTDLDGVLFRKDGVDVTNSSQKVIHSGFQPEKKIITGLEHMLALAKQSAVSQLLTALLCHFMFETVHPFYDGNGRTGRVLLAYHLRDSLSELTILSLSQAISTRKKLYYDALRDARDLRNYGELTGYLLDMLELIQEAQKSVIADLKQAQGMMNALEEQLQQLDLTVYGLSDKEIYKNILFQVGQHYIFGSELGLSLPEILSNLPQSLGEQTLRKHCKDLEEKGFLSTTSKRPARFTFTESTAQTLGVSEQLFQ